MHRPARRNPARRALAPHVWSCPEGPGAYVDVFKRLAFDNVDEDELFAAADVYSVFPRESPHGGDDYEIRNDWHVHYGEIELPSGPIWVVQHGGIENFFTHNRNWRAEMDAVVDEMERELDERFAEPRQNPRFAVDPAGILSSLETAEMEHAAHQKKYATALDALPDDYVIKAGKKTWRKFIVDGHAWWTDDKRANLSSRQLLEEVGAGRLDPHLETPTPRTNPRRKPDPYAYLDDLLTDKDIKSVFWTLHDQWYTDRLETDIVRDMMRDEMGMMATEVFDYRNYSTPPSLSEAFDGLNGDERQALKRKLAAKLLQFWDAEFPRRPAPRRRR